MTDFDTKVEKMAREVCKGIDSDEKYWRQYAPQIREKLIANIIEKVVSASYYDSFETVAKKVLLNETKD